MERICGQCHAVLVPSTVVEVCPSCGGALQLRAAIPLEPSPTQLAAETDRRGILMPRRHALGGIITPQ